MNSKPIADMTEIVDVINKCDVCYVGMCDDDTPYVLPFNFAFENNILYLHSGPGGQKSKALSKNNKICVAFSTDHKIYSHNNNVACSWGMSYKSALIWGNVEYITDNDIKEKILNLFMKKYAGTGNFKYNLPALNNVIIYKIIITKITGKKKG